MGMEPEVLVRGRGLVGGGGAWQAWPALIGSSPTQGVVRALCRTRADWLATLLEPRPLPQ